MLLNKICIYMFMLYINKLGITFIRTSHKIPYWHIIPIYVCIL